MRKLVAAIMLLVMVLSLCGCQKTGVTMTVKEYRTGHGIAGQDFSGYKEYKVKNIKEGDYIVGGIFGSELHIAEDEKEYKNFWFLKIDAVSENGVAITTYDGTSYTRSYKVPLAVDSPTQMSDGPNYSYELLFR